MLYLMKEGMFYLMEGMKEGMFYLMEGMKEFFI